ncbi:MAG: excinuclease ABC subunit UvrC, partial [Fimbriiglobus sp.]
MPRRRPGAPAPGLFAPDTFARLGPSRFRPADEVPATKVVRGRGEARLRERVRADAPRLPGIYAMLDARGRVVYVGKAKNLRARL